MFTLLLLNSRDYQHKALVDIMHFVLTTEFVSFVSWIVFYDAYLGGECGTGFGVEGDRV